MSTRQETSQPSERVLLTTGLKLCYSVYTPFSHRSHCINYFPLIHSCPLVPQGCFLIDLPYWQSAAVLIFKKKKKKSNLWRTFHFHSSDCGCKTPLEKVLWVWRLIVTIHLPVHKGIFESLWSSGAGHPHMTRPLTGISCQEATDSCTE